MDRGFGRALRDLTALQEMREEGRLLQNRRGGTTSKEFNQRYANPAYKIALTLMEVSPISLVVTIVAAGILRRMSRAAES